MNLLFFLAGDPSQGGGFESLFFLVPLFLVFYLFIISFKIGFDILLEHALVKCLEILICIQFTEDQFVRNASKRPQFSS